METAREVLRQLWEGDDFTPPVKLLSNISAPAAVTLLPNTPYSIATNVAHADIWQRLWLCRLQGKPKFNPFPDFPVVEAADWASVRESFLENFQLALNLARAEPCVALAKSHDMATKLFIKIAVHNAYHVGQVALLKRILRSSKHNKA